MVSSTKFRRAESNSDKDLQQLNLSNNDVKRLKKFYRFTREDEQRLTAAEGLLKKNIVSLLDTIDEEISSDPDAAQSFTSADRAEHNEHLEDLTGGNYSHEYFDRRAKCGHEIGLRNVPPKWFVGANALLLDGIAGELAESMPDAEERYQTLRSFCKLLIMDMGTSLESFAHARQNLLEAEEKAVQNAVEFNRGLLNAAATLAIMTISETGTVQTWNKGAEHVFGYTADEIVGKDFRQFYPKDVLDQGQVDLEFREATSKGHVSAEGWRLAKGNRPFYGRASFSALRAEDGTLIGYVKIVQDDTERKNNELAIQKAEEFNRGVLNAANTLAIYAISEEGIVQSWNKGAEHVFGLTEKEAIGKDFRMFYPKDELDRGQVEYEMREASAKGGVSAEGWRISKGNKLFYAKASLSALTGPDGKLMGYVKIVQDETERKQSQDAMHKAEEFTRGVLNAANSIAIYAISESGIIQSWNRGSEHVFGYTAEEVLGKNFTMFYPKEDIDRGQTQYEINEARTRGAFAGEGWRLSKSGKFFAKASLCPLMSNDGKNLLGYVKIVQDETQRKRGQDQLAEQRKEMSELVSVLNGVIAQVASVSSELSASTAQSVAAISETTVTAEEVKQTAEQASQKAQAVSKDSKLVAQVSKQGQEATDATIKGMVKIREQMESIGACMVQLSNQSKLIGDIIATVDDLAQQSNLLAVNASIEAAKAGEQGKGFAVVAQEVKNLSQQSKAATRQVRSILNDIVKATTEATTATEQGTKSVESGHSQASETGNVIKALAENMERAALATETIEISAQQQLLGMKQMVDAMDSIKQAAESNLEGATQLEQTGAELDKLSKKLLGLMNSAD